VGVGVIAIIAAIVFAARELLKGTRERLHLDGRR
jgi:hypothetical protein